MPQRRACSHAHSSAGRSDDAASAASCHGRGSSERACSDGTLFSVVVVVQAVDAGEPIVVLASVAPVYAGAAQLTEKSAGRPAEPTEADDRGGDDGDRPAKPTWTPKEPGLHAPTTSAPTTAHAAIHTRASTVKKVATRC